MRGNSLPVQAIISGVGMLRGDIETMSLKAKIEAVIYASEEPVTLAQLAGLLGHEAQAELDHLDSAQRSLLLDPPEEGDQASDQTSDPDALSDEIFVQPEAEAYPEADQIPAEIVPMSIAEERIAVERTDEPGSPDFSDEKGAEKKAAREEKARASRLR